MNHRIVCGAIALLAVCAFPAWAQDTPYPVVETGQGQCYGDTGVMPCPVAGQPFAGQDAQYLGREAHYRGNGDGTVSDLVTGLMWVRERGEKMFWGDAMDRAKSCRVGGYDDWRAPTIKELYSLIDFRGHAMAEAAGTAPFLDTRYFGFAYGDTAAGERAIDCQDWSSTTYVGTTMNGAPTAFGVNFADGRIKGYPRSGGVERNKRYVRYVRGNPDYGKNRFEAVGDASVRDAATGLVWQRQDSGKGLNWGDALGYCESLSLGGHDDWRLPDAKELQSIVDYTRSPAATGGAAIDPVFGVTDPESYYWTGTTHLDGPNAGGSAVYVAFGRAMGYFAAPRGDGQKRFIDVHGAGAQRSDPKAGDPAAYAQGFGPQGDDRRILNYVRCVRGGLVVPHVPSSNATDRAPWAPSGVGVGAPVKMPPPPPAGPRPGGRGPGGPGGPGEPGGPGRRGLGGNGPGPGAGMGGAQGPRPAPPAAALRACEGRPQGAACAFDAPHGLVQGLCRAMGPDAGGELACVPDRR